MAEQAKRNSDGFSTFLESVKRRQSAQQTRKVDPMRLLDVLLESPPIAVPDLMVSSGLVLADFTAALNAMVEAGLVSLTEQAGREIVRLTAAGEQLARVAR